MQSSRVEVDLLGVGVGAMITMREDDTISELLHELSDARSWPERFQRDLDMGSDVEGEIEEAGKKIEALENRAKETIKKLGCVSPQTRTISQSMADMLISWYAFKDSLTP
jgi:hypothetical protein